MNPLTIASMALVSTSLVKERNFIKENWKPILGIGATIGFTFVIWNIYSDWKKDPNATQIDLKTDTRYPPTTLSESQAVMKANALQQAMGTFGMVNDNELKIIKSVLAGLTYNDFIAVSKAFGNRGYITISGISKDSDFLAPKKNLSYWLSKELPQSDLDSLRKIIPNAF